MLTLLPGLGDQRAQAIVLDRIRFGPVGTWEELHRIHGFGPALVDALRPHTVLGGQSSGSGRPDPERPVR